MQTYYRINEIWLSKFTKSVTTNSHLTFQTSLSIPQAWVSINFSGRHEWTGAGGREKTGILLMLSQYLFYSGMFSPQHDPGSYWILSSLAWRKINTASSLSPPNNFILSEYNWCVILMDTLTLTYFLLLPQALKPPLLLIIAHIHSMNKYFDVGWVSSNIEKQDWTRQRREHTFQTEDTH